MPLYRAITFAFQMFLCHIILAQTFVIPDPAFAAKLNEIVPQAVIADQLNTTHWQVLQLTTMPVGNSGITDLNGIQFFTALENLDCSDNLSLTIPELPATIKYFNCENSGMLVLPLLPPALEQLFVSHNELSQLPPLPPTLTWLDCKENDLTSLPSFGDLIYSIDCRWNLLNTLPSLPASLYQLDCSFNTLVELPALPQGLASLSCHNNQLTELPLLPASLNYINCYDNLLSTLPNIPDSVVSLRCERNLISYLPSMANSTVSQFICSENLLTQLPELPADLNTLWCNDNPGLKCLPQLPNTLQNLNCVNTQLTCLPNMPLAFDPANMFWADFTASVCHAGMSNCTLKDELITGHVFYDNDQDAVRDPGELPIISATVEGQPGSHITAPDSTGYYALRVDTGTTILQGRPLLHHIVTTAPVPITLQQLEIDSLNDIGYYMIPGIHDLRVFLQAGPSRPGFDNILWMRVENVGTTTTTANIELNVDATMSWVSSTTTPYAVNGSQISWNQILAPGEIWNHTSMLYLSPTSSIGTPFQHMLHADPSGTDAVPEDNTTLSEDVIVGSYDPNDKRVEPTELSPMEVSNGSNIMYVIRFQNTGTYPAERVVITDTLSSDLDRSSLQFNGSSHQCEWYVTNGVLHVIHDDIFLPDSVSDEPNSHGYVSFSITPNTDLLVGDLVHNEANIYFDFNEPVITDPCALSISSTVDVAEAADQMNFNIRPNPCSASCSLFFNDRYGDIFWIEILDVHGRVVDRMKGQSGYTMLTTTSLPSGVYMIKLIDGMDQVHTERLVIDR